MNEISPVTTIVSAILLVVVLMIALNLRKKIKRNEESGNEFSPWERAEKLKAPDEWEAGTDDELRDDELPDDEDDEDEKDGNEDEDEE